MRETQVPRILLSPFSLYVSHNNINEHLTNKQQYEELVNRLEEKFSEQKVYSKMLPETELGEYSVLGLANNMDDIKNKCSIIIQKLQKDLDLIDVEKKK